MSIMILMLALTGGFTLLVCSLIRGLRKLYYQPKANWPDGQAWPRVAVIISLRGCDPFLEKCLRNLINQDYGNFVLYVVVDSAADPAWKTLKCIQSEYGRECMQLLVLHNPLKSCSLKNSALVQAIGELPRDFQIVAFVDADAITSRHWLRDLIIPFADPQVGCTTGIRWFAPLKPTFASRVRCSWNHFAAAILYRTGTPWGGSMAIRRFILDSGLTREWSRMLCEDVHTARHLHHRGLKLAYVPDATIINQETVTLRGCLQFVQRQTLLFSLYHREWRFVAAFTGLGLFLGTLQVVLLVSTLLQGEWLICLALIAIRRASLLTIWREAGHLESAIRQKAIKSDQAIPAAPRVTFLASTCAELFSAYSALAVFASRSMKWRGISYHIRGPEQVTLLAYQPYPEDPAMILAERSSIV